MEDVNISKYRASVVRDGSKPASPGFVVSEGQDPVNPPGTNNYVPYSGATANVELGEYGVEAGFITLDTTPTNTPADQGTIFWDADDETVDIILNGYTMKIGEDLFYPVKNQTGSTIAKGTAVRFNGTVGNSGRLLIAPFIANGSVPSNRFMGVTAEEILNGEDGKVLYFGRIRGINTNAFNEGDILYASTTVAGGFQTAIPVAPNNIVLVAAVVTKSINQGTIFVRPTLASNLNTDEAVKITSVANLDLLQYQSGTGLWENKTLAQILGGTSSQFVKGNGSLDSNTYLTTSAAASTYVPYTGATSNVDLGSNSLSSRNLIANGGILSGALLLKNAGQASLIDTGYFKLSPVSTSTEISFGFSTGASTWKQFSFSSHLLPNNTITGFNLPSGGGTLAVVGGAGVGTVTSVGLSSATSGVTIGSTPVTTSGTITLTIATASGSQQGLLSAADWTTFNNKQNALTNPVTGTGTTNYLPKFTGSTTIGNSLFTDNGTIAGVGNALIGNARFNILNIASNPALSIRSTNNLYEVLTMTFNETNDLFSITNKQAFAQSGIAFGTNNTQRMLLDVNGNLGLGVTPSARLHVNANDGLNEGIAAAIIRQGGSSGNNGIVVDVTNTPGIYVADFRIANSSVARITNTGNLLVGTTTDNGAKLQVSGTSRFSGNVGIGVAPSSDALNVTGIDYNNSAYFLGGSTTGASYGIQVRAGTNSTDYSLLVQSRSGSDYFRVRGDGAATFSSSVTSGTHNINNLGVINLNSQNGFQLGADSFSGGFYIYDNTTGIYRFKIANGGAATFSSSVTTGAPAGGTAQPWKLGTVATVSPTSPNRTIEVEVNGTTYYLHAKTTNN